MNKQVKEGLGGALVLGIIVAVWQGISGGTSGSSDPPPLTWHYVGPASKADLVKQAMDILTQACPRLLVYNEYLDKPQVAWRVVDRSDPLWRLGVRAAVNVSTRYKATPIDPPARMPVFPKEMFNGREEAVFILMGPPANAILISGKGGMTICDVSRPPIGGAPVTKLAPQLSGLLP